MRWEGIRARLRLLLAPRAAERRMDDEFRFHIEMETARLVREERLDRRTARRKALVAFGAAESYKEELREGRGLGWLSGVSLDVKLGFRMLVKYPGLTVVGGLAMAFAICVGAAGFEFLTQAFRPTLPLPGGDRIVGITNWDAAGGSVEMQALHDFVTWRAQVESVEDIGAFRTLELNLITAEGSGGAIEVAEMSASGFRVAGVPPLLGRPLVADDERPGALPVVVLGFDIWQRYFRGDPEVIGRTVRLGREPTTVVGVMPEGFAFPVVHNLWIPLALNPLDYERREGPGIQVFGRLAVNATLASAQAELTLAGRAAAAAFPRTHEHLLPRVMPYARSIMAPNIYGVDASGALVTMLGASLNLPLVLFLVLVCGNVALLIFARAATRESEIVVRNALGASRRRIIAQLFVEALVLGAAAALVGLAAAGLALRWGVGAVQVLGGARLPFWFHAGLSPATVFYAALLTVVGAAIAGVVPALKVTRALGARLRAATAGGGGFRFGGLWTAVIIVQIGVTMVLPVTILGVWLEARAIRIVDVGFSEREYLAVRLQLDRGAEADVRVGEPATDSAAASRTITAPLQSTLEELDRRLMAEPGVTGVTFADRFPRMYHPYRLVELDAGPAAPLDPERAGYRVSSARVATDYFDVLGVPILAGRGFHAGDLVSDAKVVIVNQSFVQNVLGGGNAIGRRLRYVGFEERDGAAPPEVQPWYEIAGVVRDLGMAYGNDPKVAGFYHPVAPGGATPRMALHVSGEPAAFAARLRSIAAAVDPALRLDGIMPLEDVTDSELRFYALWFWFLAGVTSIALLLALAGIYAVMAFTVSQRTREIGIRVALGAGRRHIVTTIFRRPLEQVAFGVLAGGGLLAAAIIGGTATLKLAMVGALLAYAALMMGVCLLAAIVPTFRALSIEPGDALRWE